MTMFCNRQTILFCFVSVCVCKKSTGGRGDTTYMNILHVQVTVLKKGVKKIKERCIKKYNNFFHVINWHFSHAQEDMNFVNGKVE